MFFLYKSIHLNVYINAFKECLRNAPDTHHSNPSVTFGYSLCCYFFLLLDWFHSKPTRDLTEDHVHSSSSPLIKIHVKSHINLILIFGFQQKSLIIRLILYHCPLANAECSGCVVVKSWVILLSTKLLEYQKNPN